MTTAAPTVTVAGAFLTEAHRLLDVLNDISDDAVVVTTAELFGPLADVPRIPQRTGVILRSG